MALVLQPFDIDTDIDSLIGWMAPPEDVRRTFARGHRLFANGRPRESELRAWVGRNRGVHPIDPTRPATDISVVALKAVLQSDSGASTAIGCVVLRIDEADARAYLDYVYVAPAWRGHRLGTAVVRQVLDVCFCSIGVHSAETTLFAGSQHVDALMAYLRNGFQMTGRRRQAIRMGDGAWADIVVLDVLRPDWEAAKRDDERHAEALRSATRTLMGSVLGTEQECGRASPVASPAPIGGLESAAASPLEPGPAAPMSLAKHP